MFPELGSMEPTGDDLSDIEYEWPVIAAGLDLLKAEIALICAEDHGGPTDLDWQRVRRARRRVLRAVVEVYGRPSAAAPLLLGDVA